MDSDMVSKQATQRKNARSGLSLIEVMLMLTLLAATVLPCSLLLSQTGQNTRAAYLQSTRRILLSSLADEATDERPQFTTVYNMGSMQTNISESGQVLPWRAVVDTTNAGASDTFQKTIYFYLYNNSTDAANAPRYTTKLVTTTDTQRYHFADTFNYGHVDSSGFWWQGRTTYDNANKIAGVQGGTPIFQNYAGTITNLPAPNRDVRTFQDGWRNTDGASKFSAPVANGLYTVKLYFTERGASGQGNLMDIKLEDKLMNPGVPYNPYFYCGNQLFCAHILMYDVMVNDNVLDIQFASNANATVISPEIRSISIKKRI